MASSQTQVSEVGRSQAEQAEKAEHRNEAEVTRRRQAPEAMNDETASP